MMPLTEVIMPLLLILIIGVTLNTASAPDKPPRYSPYDWCDDVQLSKVVGVQAACAAYRDNVFNEKVNLTLLYEFYCPGCRITTTRILPALWAKFKDILNIEFVPYGNSERPTGVDCSDGDISCWFHHVTACAIHFLGNDKDTLMDLIVCMESQPEDAGIDDVLGTCFMVVPVNASVQASIRSCWHSKLGNELEEAMAERTESAWPIKPTGMPWIMLNNASTTQLQNMFWASTNEDSVRQLGWLICYAYVGDKVPKACPQNN